MNDLNALTFQSLERTFIVAEIGNNHEGVMENAERLIKEAALSGVDAVKFQHFETSNIDGGDPDRSARLERFRLGPDQFVALAEVARECGVVFFATPFERTSAQFLNSLQPIFKIASGDNDLIPFIQLVIGLNKPTIISTGMLELEELDQLYEVIKSERINQKRNLEVAFLHCISAYPTPTDQVNLKSITTLKDRYPEVTIGYSDHTIGIDAAVGAVFLGAKIIEKHFTLDKEFSDFRDHQISADPTEMKELVERIRVAEKLLGKAGKKVQPCEELNRESTRRSIVAATDLSVDAEIQSSDISWARPGTGLRSGHEHLFVGKKTLVSIRKGQQLTKEMVA